MNYRVISIIFLSAILNNLIAQKEHQFFVNAGVGKDVFVKPKYIISDNTFNHLYYNRQSINCELGVVVKKNEIAININYNSDYSSYDENNYLDPNKSIYWKTNTRNQYGFLSFGVNYKWNFFFTKKLIFSPYLNLKINTLYSISSVESYENNVSFYRYNHNELFLKKEAYYTSYALGLRINYLIFEKYLSVFYIIDYTSYLFPQKNNIYNEVNIKTPTLNNRVGINIYLNKIFENLKSSNKR